ncbi:MAG: hypothetical protein K9N09_09465 [Candidatus Cloacimonetes bacterium]|nr:hypothetical protein [Candidatus Cloacimonadota bacterium]MCF7813872.1 hypothetical protein [Candidatus Cloacimonadota bacterium]MCF7868917.1 hypothetical protein [Candidatus Cloacimonadota bacterium]MCF7883984.1 hypothetical protein [Candidatus Cloacimonadota bacterium]
MYAIIQINKEKYFDDVLMALTEAGVEDPVVFSGEALGHKLVFDMPVFAGFRSSMKPGESYAKIIMAATEEDKIDFMLEELKNSGVNFIEDEIGKIVLIPTHKIYK